MTSPPKLPDLFQAYTPGNEEIEVDKEIYTLKFCILKIPKDLDALKVWQTTTKKQHVNLSEKVLLTRSFNEQISSTRMQALTVFINNKRVCCMEISSDLQQPKKPGTKRYDTLTIDFMINPYFENNTVILYLVIETCLRYIFKYDSVKQVLWKIIDENKFFENLACQCGFDKFKIYRERDIVYNLFSIEYDKIKVW